MARTPIDTVRDNLRQSYDPRWYGHVYGLMAHTLGDRYTPALGLAHLSPGELPDFPDIMPKFYKVGESRQMLDHAKLMMMKVCYMDPDVSFPDLNALEEAVRKAFIEYVWRYQDYDQCSGAAREVHRMFLDGDNFGLGHVNIGGLDDRVHLAHAPNLQVVYDRHVLNAGRARFKATIHELPIETAVNRFGSKVKEKASRRLSDDYAAPPLERVKVIEYNDLGYGKWSPTRYYLLDNFGGEVLGAEDNEFDCIPSAHYEMFHFPGMRRPMGRIDMQFPIQEGRNALERLIKLTLKRGSGWDAVLAQHIHPEDRALLQQGVVLPLVRLVNLEAGMHAGHVIARVPPQDIPSGVFSYLTLLDREMNTASGSSDADRANLSVEDRTLGQDQMKQAGADLQTAWSRKQLAETLKVLVAKVIKIGMKVHTAPTVLSIEGQPILFNDPQNPNSYLARWLEKPSRVVVNEESMQYQDPDIEAMQKLALWKDFLQDPFTNQIELRKYLFGQMGNKKDEMIDPTGSFGSGVPQQGMPNAAEQIMPQLGQMGMQPQLPVAV